MRVSQNLARVTGQPPSQVSLDGWIRGDWAKGWIAFKMTGMGGWREIESIVQLKTYNRTTAKAKGTWVFSVVWTVLSFFSEDLQKASRDKTENNDMQMKHLMADSFEAQKEKKTAKGK